MTSGPPGPCRETEYSDTAFSYNRSVVWGVEVTDEFLDWWRELSELEHISIDRAVYLLEVRGPRRVAILLLGGDKTGDDRWSERNVPEADRIYDEYLGELQE